MSIDYAMEVNLLSDERLAFIKKYYSSWEGNLDINLKFRFLKAFVYNQSSRSSQWIFLHRWANKRRIYNHDLPIVVNALIKEGLVPIRIFHSVSEWLSPHEIDRKDFCWIIKSSILPIETDISFEESIETAKLVGEMIEGRRLYVYSGNKSIHVWWLDFDYQKYLKSTEIDNIVSAKTREKYDRIARKRFLQDIQRDISSELDLRNAIDTKRVVPIIGSINGFTGRKVTKIPEEIFNKISKDEILLQSKL